MPPLETVGVRARAHVVLLQEDLKALVNDEHQKTEIIHMFKNDIDPTYTKVEIHQATSTGRPPSDCLLPPGKRPLRPRRSSSGPEDPSARA